MKALPRVAVSIVMLMGILSAASQGEDVRRRKKLIATGWDNADTTRLRENLTEMEKRPFDGVVIEVTGQIDAKRRCHLPTTFSSEKWQRQWFQKPLEDLKACRFKRLTDNFVLVGANPGSVDWFDDEGWATIVEHWRIAAWLVKQSGLKGLLFDPEPYTPPYSQFAYPAQPQKDKHSFTEYCAKVRQRGGEVMKAVAEEYPDIVLFCYFMNSVVSHATGQSDAGAVLEREGYGLLPAFFDGWLDAAPPTVTMVDGCEGAYRYNSALEYLEAGTAMRGDCQELVSPANRAKYRAQVQVGFGMYLDAYWNPKTSPWYVDGLGGPRVDRLRENVRTALRVADEYVWVYGEKFRWWPTPNKSVKEQSWDEALPGCERVLALARNPAEYARERIAAMKAGSKIENLARNGDFGSDKAADYQGTIETWKDGRPPAGWSAWQDNSSNGTFTWDRETGAAAKGSARAQNVANGCFTQGVPVKAGQTYAVQGACRVQGKGKAWIRVRWQTADGRWTLEELDKIIPPRQGSGEWGEMFSVVDVPQGAGRLVILLCIVGRTGQQDAAWFDDVCLYKIE
jgi:hypothetical protein